MSVDELKIVLEMVSTVSGDAKTVVIAWLSIGLVKTMISWGVFIAIATIISRTISSSIAAGSCVREINDILGQPGSSRPYYAYEYRAIIDAVRKLKGKQ